MKKLIYLLIAVVLVFNFSCKDSGTGPEEKKSVRDYTWTADTLAYWRSSQTLMTSIWGSSTNDIYICGHNSSAYGNIWHYDGKEWEFIDSTQNIRQQFGGASYQAVHGSAANNVWVVGHSGTKPFILQYNGTDWKKHIVNANSRVYSVYVASANNVWACGADGIVYHYDGSFWTTDTIVPPFSGSNFQLNNLIVYKGKTYLLGNTQDLIKFQDVYYFFSGTMGNWALVDSMRLDVYNTTFKWGVGRLYASPWGKLYSSGWGIFEWNGSSWNRILPYFDNDKPIRAMEGTNENNIILVGDFGKAYHWNGNDIYQFTNLENETDPLLYTGILMNENEMFLLGHTTNTFPQKTIVWKGK